MDAYDIFKKLSRGVKFSTTHNSIFKKKTDDSEKYTVKVKQEVKEEKLDVDTESPNEQNLKDNDEITLLSTLNSNAVNRGKKRKHETKEELQRKKKLLKIEEINHYRNVNKINVVGKNIPEPAYTFDDFQVDHDIIENLKKSGYTEPTPIQKQAVPIMMQGQQILACAPTGSGKTAAFLVPIIQQLKQPQKKGFRAVILCPTRELAKQTQRECLKLSDGRNFRVHIISKINRALEQYGPKSNNKYDILVTTPKRICFLLNQEPPAISLNNVEWLVVDEADKLFEEGNRGFREQLDQIMGACTNENRKVAMFSATTTPVVAKWCVRNMKPLARVTVGHKNAAALTVDQKLLFVGDEHGKLLAFRDMIRNGISPPVLIFVQSKERAQELFNELIYDGINVDAIHADRTQLQRDNTVKAFRQGKIWILICTELMARGVDFKGVNLVINYDFPPSSISYVHRIGRAGRAGKKGSAVTFFTTADVGNLRSLAHIMKESGCEVPSYMLTIKKQNKKERKRLEKAAPQRDDISTMPIYEKLKIQRRSKNLMLPRIKKVKEKSADKPEKTEKLLKHSERSKRKTETIKAKKTVNGVKNKKLKSRKSSKKISRNKD